ncbi:MAG: hypothetical protein QOH90_685, partial [Actinomycetota bacterium]|nr:hypothetical protein [Actinomycetota bacterium]
MVAASSLLLPQGVHAQGTGTGPLEITLVGQPVWREPHQPLNIKVSISNPGAEAVTGFGLRVGVYSRARSRSALHENFDAAPGNELEAFSRPYPDQVLDPGESKTFVIDDEVETLGTPTLSSDGGVYPLTLTVYDLRSGDFLDWVTTSLIYYPADPDVRLHLVTIVPINDTPSMGPDGTFTVPSPASPALEDAALPDGWLSGEIQAL